MVTILCALVSIFEFRVRSRASLELELAKLDRLSRNLAFIAALMDSGVDGMMLFIHLSDTFSGRIGWTVEHSQSGYNAVRYHLLRYRRERPEPLFAKWVGPLMTPRRVIEAVIEGEIDVGPLDSYVHDLLEHHEPETASKLRTIEPTSMSPIPPLVASPAVGGDTVEHLRRTFLSCAAKPELAVILDTLMLAGFAPVDPADYAGLLLQARQADDGGVAKPASGALRG